MAILDEDEETSKSRKNVKVILDATPENKVELTIKTRKSASFA